MTAAQLFEEFDLESGTSSARAITTLLAEAGVTADPPLTDATGDSELTLSLKAETQTAAEPTPAPTAAAPAVTENDRQAAAGTGGSRHTLRVIIGTVIATALWGYAIYV